MKRSVVVTVVAIADIAHRRLRGRGLQRGVRIHQSIGGKKARIRNAPDADATVIVRNVFDQPVDRVVRVGAFVGVRGGGEVRLVGGNVDKGAFGKIAAANVLIDDDEPVPGENVGRAQALAVVVDTVGRHRIGRALHQDGVLLRVVLRDVDGGKELHAVAHGNAVIEFGVVSTGVLGLFAGGLFGRRSGLGLRAEQRQQTGREKQTHHENIAWLITGRDQWG